MTNEFQFISPSDLGRPPVEAHQDGDHLILHSEVSPFGWIASDVAVEVNQ